MDNSITFKIDLYTLNELIESGLIRDEYNIQSEPNKKNKYLLVIPNDDNIRVTIMDKAIRLIRLNRAVNIVIYFNLILILIIAICILFD